VSKVIPLVRHLQKGSGMLRKFKIRVVKKDQSSDYMESLVNMDTVRCVLPSGIDDGIQMFEFVGGGNVLVKTTMEEVEGAAT
jgi:hypothetical protein